MAPAFDSFVEWLQEQYGESLRWVASFDSDRFAYKVRYIREDLQTELTGHQLDTLIHRSMAVYNRRHLEDVYNHLGTAQSMVVEHDRATAVHVYFRGSKGVVVKLKNDVSVTTPGFTQDAMAKLFPEDQ